MNPRTRRERARREPFQWSRRDLVKLGLMSGAATLIGSRVLRPTPAFAQATTCAGQDVIEVFPTSPLILDPFTDELPIPQPLVPTNPADWPEGSNYGPPNPQTGGVQDCDGELHQLGCGAVGSPAPVYYRIPLQVGAHSFSSSKVLPIDSNGNPVGNGMIGYEFLPNYDPAVGLALPDSTIYGYNGKFPGAMIYARYGQPACIRFVNELDENPLGLDRGDFGVTEFLTHLHNGHTAPESDGNPNHKPTAYEPKGWCDNLYLNWAADGDSKEKQSTLWFHDHRMDHTGANVYKGMVGLYPIYDPEQNKDNGIETKGYRLPGVTNPATRRVDYDIPLAFYDCNLDDGVTPHQDFHNGCGETHPEQWGKTFFRHFPNHGFVGDVFTVNGKAYPTLTVKRRRHRLRFLDASIARLYELVLMSSTSAPVAAKDTGRSGVKLQGQYQLPDGQQCMKMVQIASEGGLLPFPFLRNSVEIWPAKRREVIVDFSKYMDGTPTTKGDVIYLVNVKQMTTGRKPNQGTITHDPETGVLLTAPILDPDFDPNFRVPVLKIVIGDDAPDNSLDPLDYVNKENGTCTLKLNPLTKLPILAMRPLPNMPKSFKGFTSRTFELQRSGAFGGEVQWLINGLPFEPTAQLAFPTKGAGELWTIRNGGGGWVHPMHLHEEEHRVISRNGVLTPTDVSAPLLYNKTYNGHDHPDDVGKEDVVALDPGEEVVVYRKFRSFTGPYVAHCHNLAHEDHAMMFGWKIV